MVSLRRITAFVSLIPFLTASIALGEQELQVTAQPDRVQYAPGDTVVVALQVAIPAKYHLYGNPLGPGIGKPLLIRGEGNEIRWLSARKMPAEKFHPEIGDWVWAYEKEAVFFVKGVLGEEPGETASGTIVLDGLICHTACVPTTRSVSISLGVGESEAKETFERHPDIRSKWERSEEMPLSVGTGTSEAVGTDDAFGGLSLGGPADEADASSSEIPEWDYQPVEKRAELGLWLAVILAFLAGMILNVMPCVLPVLGIKILSFSQGTQGRRRDVIVRSLSFGAGMILVFELLAVLAAFAGFSWGEQFQNPIMLIAIIGLIFVFALGMFDIYTILVPTSVAAMEQKSGHGVVGDFFKGMFTTVLATPCSGPFLGATLAWTLRQTPFTIFAVFTALGVGMAAPYVVFSMSRKLMSIIPKPGKWMEDFKHFLGFILFGFAVYLLIGVPKDMQVGTILLCVFLAFALAVYGRYAPFGSSWKRKLGSISATLAISLLGVYVSFGVLYPAVSENAALDQQEHKNVWREFSPELLSQAHDRSQPVIVNFTANWCMNCQYNKMRILHSKEIAQLIVDKNVLALTADITQENPPAESLLHHLGSRSVPFLAIFPGDNSQHPIIMRDLLNKGLVEKRLRELKEETGS